MVGDVISSNHRQVASTC